MIISKPTMIDARGIQVLFYETWLDTYPNAEVGITRDDVEEMFRKKFTKEGLELVEKNILDEVSNRLLIVAKDGERVVGICRAYVRDLHNQLQAIYVLPSHQRRGIGKLFWEECLKFFDPTKNTIVHVATYNTKAISFYEKCGFVDSGKRLTEERHRMPISKALIPEMEMVLRVVLQKSLPK